MHLVLTWAFALSTIGSRNGELPMVNHRRKPMLQDYPNRDNADEGMEVCPMSILIRHQAPVSFLTVNINEACYASASAPHSHLRLRPRGDSWISEEHGRLPGRVTAACGFRKDFEGAEYTKPISHKEVQAWRDLSRRQNLS